MDPRRRMVSDRLEEESTGKLKETPVRKNSSDDYRTLPYLPTALLKPTLESQSF